MKKYDGSITVEMTLVFPVVLLSIFAIIMLGFYMNDIVCTRGIFQQYGIISNMNDYDEASFRNELTNALSDTLIVSEINNLNINKGKNKTNIEVDIGMDVKFFGIKKVNRIRVEMCNENNREFVTGAKVVIDMIGRN